MWDDQSLVMHVRDRGLFVLSACSHAEAVNVVHNACRLTGVDRLHAFVGGLHLSGPAFEPILGVTIAALAGFAPDYLVPGHCSGWRATHALYRTLPDAYVQTSVVTTLRFGSSTVG